MSPNFGEVKTLFAVKDITTTSFGEAKKFSAKANHHYSQKVNLSRSRFPIGTTPEVSLNNAV